MALQAALEVATTLDHQVTPTPMVLATRTPQIATAAQAAQVAATTLDHQETPIPMVQATRTPRTHMAAPAAPEEVTTTAHQVRLIRSAPLETPQETPTPTVLEIHLATPQETMVTALTTRRVIAPLAS
jgi:hypothetical protein